MPAGGYVQAPQAVEEPAATPPVEEVQASPVEEEVQTEEPKIEASEAPSEETPVTSVDPLAGLSPTSTKAALQAKADELGLTVPDGAKRSDIWNLLKAHVSV